MAMFNTVCAVLHILMSLCWQNIVFDCSIANTGSLSGLNARTGRSVCYNNSLLHQAVHRISQKAEMNINTTQLAWDIDSHGTLRAQLYRECKCFIIMPDILQALMNCMKTNKRPETLSRL